MNWWLFTLPFISSIFGWLVFKIAISLIFHPSVFLTQQQQLAEDIGSLVSREFSQGDFESKLGGSESLEKIMPFVEGHVDTFLRVKLGEKMPMIKMFVGERTLDQMKEIFLAELRELFPLIMSQYIGNLQQEINIEKLVAQKISGLPVETVEASVKKLLSKQFRLVKMAGAVTGFIIGLINLFIVIVTT